MLKEKAVLDQVNVENVVVSGDFGKELDLENLVEDLGSNAQYDAENFPGLIYRERPGKEIPEDTKNPTCLLFRSGKTVSTGADSVKEGRKSIRRLGSKLKELGIPTDTVSPTVQNLVATTQIVGEDENVNLNAMAIGLGLENVEYEPEQFPGLVYRPEEAEVVILIFRSGQTVITGSRSIEESKEGAKIFIDRLDELNLL